MTEMAEQQGFPDGGSVAELREHARRLASELPGALRRVSVRSGETTIEVEWQRCPGHDASTPDMPAPHESAVPPAGAVSDDHFLVHSPMVGTFYRAPGPDAPPFVEPGDTVAEGQTVAVVEAMKLFNPISAERAGVVVEVLAEDGQPVEFDQPLLRLAMAGGED
jgi:acetyl-CoA carboxylase biotin carboxyl carrier protein